MALHVSHRVYFGLVVLTTLIQPHLLVTGVTLPTISKRISDPVYTDQFQSWYEQFADQFNETLYGSCVTEYQKYKQGEYDVPTASNVLDGADEHSVLTEPVIECILNNTSEFIQSSMSSAQVLLGLTPTILGLLGISTEELSLLSIVGRRPILAMLLSLASPSVFVSRAFEYSNPVDMMQDRRGRLRQYSPRGKRFWALSVTQYAIAVGAVINIVLICRDLGLNTICIFWSNTIYAPAIWAVLVMTIHLLGAIVMRIRVKRVFEDPVESGLVYEKVCWMTWFRKMPDRIRSLRRTEHVPAVRQKDVFLVVFPERPLFVFLSWFLSIVIVCHVIFGTLVLSSTTFVGPRDALAILGRFMTSVLCCRVVCMYEIAGLRERCSVIVQRYQKPESRDRFEDDEPRTPTLKQMITKQPSMDSLCLNHGEHTIKGFNNEVSAL
ncbi:hypothetical protein BX600DRAFT_514890 [Xylariales sp. PMI_506]|nr:hypothetical protein BX600DRAFT_514890 [Xylariales sp. PMI_506]